MYGSNSISHTTISPPPSPSNHQNQDFGSLHQMFQNPYSNIDQPPTKPKKKRNQPGNPDPEAEVIALSPKSLMATNRFVCEVCNKGFQRDQNLQLHRRGHNLPWKLKSKENKKRAYVCPEPSCVHHDPLRALGDLTGIKKHYCRKHGEKKLKCDKCKKLYAVKSDWKAHSKVCGNKEYKCACGTIFTRKDSFVTHKAYCEAVAEENAGKLFSTTINLSYSSSPPPSSLFAPNPNIMSAHTNPNPQLLIFNNPLPPPPPPQLTPPSLSQVPPFISHRFSNPYWDPLMPPQNPNHITDFLHAQNQLLRVKHEPLISQEAGFNMMVSPSPSASPLPPLSATALLQRAMGSFSVGPTMGHVDMMKFSATWHDVSISGGTTRDFLGLAGEQGGDVGASSSGFSVYDHDESLFGG